MVASARSTTSTRSRGSGRRGSSSCGTWSRRDRRAALADAARSLAACLGLALANACAGAGARRDGDPGCGGGRRCCRAEARLLACAARARRSPAGGGAPRVSTRSTAACSCPSSDGSAPLTASSPARRGGRRSRFAFPRRCADSIERSLRERVLLELPARALAARRAPSSTCRAVVRRPAGPRTASTSAAGSRGAASTSSSRGGDWRVVGRRGGIGGVSDRLRAHVARAIAPGHDGERRACSRGSCWARTRGSRTSSGTTSRRRASTTCWRYRDRTSRSWRWACWGLRGCSGSRDSPAELLAIGPSPPTCSRSVGSRRSSGQGSPARSRRSRGSPRGRATAGTSSPSGAAVLLAWTPASLLEPGFQLSFAAVGSIFLLVPRLRLALEGYPMPAWLREVLAVSTACGARDGADPLAPVRQRAGLLVARQRPRRARDRAAARARAGRLARRAAAAVGGARARLAERLAGGVHRRVRCASSAGCPSRRSAPVPPCACCSARRSRCSASAACRRWRRAAAARSARAAIVPALLAWQLVPTQSLPPPTGLRVTFLDVGQGDSILLQVPEGAVLVDQGPPEGDVARQLRELGVRRLAAVVLTHPQRDHIGGAEAVLRGSASSASSTRIWPRRASTDEPRSPQAAERGVAVVEARAGDSYRLGQLRLRVLWPDRPGTETEDPNRLPVVLLATYGDTDALADRRRRDRRHRAAHVPSGRDPQGRPPRLCRSRSRKRAARAAAHDRGDLVRSWQRLRPSDVRRRSRRCGQSPGLSLYRTDEDGRVVVESDGRRLSVRTDR